MVRNVWHTTPHTAYINYKQPSINIRDDEHSTSSELDTEMRTKHKLLYTYDCAFVVSIAVRITYLFSVVRLTMPVDRNEWNVIWKWVEKIEMKKKSQNNSGNICMRVV